MELRADREDGFSMVEMLVVLTIIGVASAIALPNLMPRSVNSPERQTAAAMQLAQTARMRAISSGKPVSIVIDSQSNDVRLEPGTEVLKLPPSISMEAVVGRDSKTTVDRGSITFFTNGGATGGQITFGDKSGRRSALRVDWLTGAMKEIDDARQ